jgi:tRNA(fMet)-specific endonuclease VapC
MRYLLDTNACIKAMRGVTSVVGAMARHAPADIAVSSITCYELYTGIEKCADPQREHTKVEALLGAVSQVVFDRPAAIASARIRADLESRGEMIGPYDILLAGQAQSLSLILVTANIGEFYRIPNLAVENWELAAP